MRRDLIAIGALSLLAQVVLLRELSVAFYGSELIVLLALGAWLLGTGLGALAGRGTRVRALFLLAGALVGAAFTWARVCRIALGGVPGAYLPIERQLLALMLAVLPPALVFGALFRRVAQAGRSVPAAYAWESAGALAGGAAATLLLRVGVSNFAAGALCALACAALFRPGRAALMATAALVVLLAVLAPPLDRGLARLAEPGLVEMHDSPYGRVTLTRWAGQLNVFQNGALAYETGGTAAEEFVTVAALAHPNPRRILVLGGTAAGLVEEALAQHPAVLEVVELDTTAQALLALHRPAARRMRPVVADPRRHLERAAERYDLILVGMPEPSSGQTNRYYTREFFIASAARLAPGGVLAFRLPAAENLWTPALTRRMASIDRALRVALRHALWLPGTTSLVLASNAPLAADPDTFAARLARRGLHPRLVTPAYLRYLLTNDRVAEIARALAAASAPANSDARPVCYSYTLVLWLSRFFPRLAYGAPVHLARGTALGAALVLVALLLVLGRRPAMLAAAAGFAGMVAESVLLLAYQSRSGVLYQDLGLLLMAFMAGLAIGAAGWPRAARFVPARALAAGLLLYGAALTAALHAQASFGLAVAGLWLAGAGALTAALFAQASRRAGDPGRAAGRLYGADLLGGCLGSLAASLALIPLAGLAGSALVIAVFGVLAFFWF